MNKFNIHVETGGLSVIASGSGITFSKSADFNFSVRFTFHNNILKKTPDFNIITNKEKNIIDISCINFNNVSEVGLSKPLNIATYKNKKIYMKFCVKTLSENENREILYCFYMEKENA